MVYKCTDLYAAEHERTLRWDDPALGISWPIGPGAPLVSAKDSAGLDLQTHSDLSVTGCPMRVLIAGAGGRSGWRSGRPPRPAPKWSPWAATSWT